jgi:hypothetical protein
MKHLSIPTLIITLAIASPAVAQVAPSPIGTPSPLGVTTPLGMGPGAPVAPVGIPLGATQLSSPGASPAVAGIVPQNAISGNTAACRATISPMGCQLLRHCSTRAPARCPEHAQRLGFTASANPAGSA